MNAQEMWKAFSVEDGITAEYDAWAFGVDADELASLVERGIKTATASAFPMYAYDGEPLPKPGEYSVILNSRGEAVCVVKTTKVFFVPFREVDERQAWKEGEGDRTLSYWRTVHERFFRENLAEAGLEFDPDMGVVCEEFIKVYPI